MSDGLRAPQIVQVDDALDSGACADDDRRDLPLLHQVERFYREEVCGGL